MGRSGYTEDCENVALWRGAVERALYGKRGQAFLRELIASLDAMPEKVLIAEQLIDSEGRCCALGAVYKSRGIGVDAIDYWDAGVVGDSLGIARAMAAEIEYMNDEHFSRITPAERWVKIREWAKSYIIKLD